MKKTYISVCLAAAAMILSSSSLYPFADQTTSERILRENKEFIDFVNVCMTNFGESKKDDFLKIYEKHFNADVAYLQCDYRRTYKRVYSSQTEMSKLYEDMLKNYYLEDSKNILDKLAPGIIKSKNPRARLFLTLGYRDRTVSWTHLTIGESSNPKLHSYKLYKYVEGIKMARRAKRYGFLAMFESQKDQVKKAIYIQLLKNERKDGIIYMNRFIDLKDDDFIKELSITYDEFEKRKDEKTEKTPADTKDAGAVKEVKNETASVEKKTFDSNVEKRVRYRQETKTGRYLLNYEFDKAEDIMRKYVSDFNYKLISAAFEVLSSGSQEKHEGEKPAPESEDRFDYNQYKVHLLDNYARLSRESMISGFMGKIKVEDDLKKTEEKKEEGADKKTDRPADEKKDAESKNKVADDKPAADVKKDDTVKQPEKK